jgi:exodeoxyribonuclease-5
MGAMRPDLPDATARLTALKDHDRTLLVEAGAGSGKTALMAGRVVMMLVAGVKPKDIAAITFTEAAASELLERIERFVGRMLRDEVPDELQIALRQGLSPGQRDVLECAAKDLDEITCTTIHGFCQQLLRPYPVETGVDPGAVIIDPAAAELAFQDLMDAWLSARFGRDRSSEGLGRIPPMAAVGGEEDFFCELLLAAPDSTLDLISGAAAFIKEHRTAKASHGDSLDRTFSRFIDAVAEFADWYNGCGVVETTTSALMEDLGRVADLLSGLEPNTLTGRQVAQLLRHQPPIACKKDSVAFKSWMKKGKWVDAAKAHGMTKADGEQLSNAGDTLYQACGEAYTEFCGALGQMAFQRFVAEFDVLKELYAQYKRDAALLDFDDLLHHLRDLLATCEPVRMALARRYPRVLVDEFQDTDPLQAEILWRLAGNGAPDLPWQQREIRPGALFLVGDPKQAIYRFRNADVATYLTAKEALATADPAAILEISANFRSQAPILEFVNANFSDMLDASHGQPGFVPLVPMRPGEDRPAVAAYEILIEDRHKNDKGKVIADAVRREEALIVADIVERLIGTYQVWDKGLRAYRAARAGDIALLAPTGSSLWIYERALESRNVPIASQAGKGFFRRQEVQDLIAVARAIADRRDTLALGALLRGPVIGLTEEEIADEIEALRAETDSHKPLHLWTDPLKVTNVILKRSLTILQNLARKARGTTPHQLMAEAVEELQIRSILKARYRHGAERALANVDLVLEMARPYATRGITDFAKAMWQRWEDAESQAEGRPDAEENAVSIVTMHSSKGLEWPIVIPINSMTKLHSSHQFLYRRQDDTIHFAVLGFASPDFERVKQDEADEQERERVRLWYVALTRARDLLLVPRQSERSSDDWFSLLDLDLNPLPAIVLPASTGSLVESAIGTANMQNLTTWEREAAAIAAAEQRILWRQPSRHEGPTLHEADEVPVFSGAEEVDVRQPSLDRPEIQGGRERGLVLHKLLEEVLTGETDEAETALRVRAAELLGQLGMSDSEDAAAGPSSREMAATALAGLRLPEIAALRPRLRPEVPVFASETDEKAVTLTSGIADAAAMDDDGKITVVIDWKSDVDPGATTVELYRAQVRDYLAATGAASGLIVFLSTGRVETAVPFKRAEAIV